MIDPKPIGAFIEYTVKPIIDDARELIELCKEHGILSNHLLTKGLQIFIFQQIMSFITAVTCTGLICLTVYFCLHTSH